MDEKSIDAKYLELPKVKEGFLDGTLDAAFVTAGVQAPIFPELFETGLCFMLSIPYAEALAAKYVFMSQYKIPAGLYRYRSPAAPATDIATVALGTQLLTRGDLHAGLVEEVTKIVLSENFLNVHIRAAPRLTRSFLRRVTPDKVLAFVGTIGLLREAYFH